MQVSEMHYHFKLLRDEIDSNDKKEFRPWEVDAILYDACMIYVNDRFNPDKIDKAGFEFNSKRIQNLSNIHIKSPEIQEPLVPIQSSTVPGLYELKLNLLGKGSYNFRFLFLTKLDADISINGCTKKCKVLINQSNDSLTTFSQPSFYWRRLYANFGRSSLITTSGASTQTEILGGPTDATYLNEKLQSIYLDTRDVNGVPQFNILRVYPSYIKYPNKVFVGGYDTIDGKNTRTSPPVHCDLDDAAHLEIVRLAVDLSFRSTQDNTGVQLNAPIIAQDKL